MVLEINLLVLSEVLKLVVLISKRKMQVEARQGWSLQAFGF